MSGFCDNHFEYRKIGAGERSIIFLNGFRMKYDSWGDVYNNLPEGYSILLFNRLGVGSSSKARVRQTGSVVVNDVHGFLSRLEMKAPYLFVAHSLGGIYANLYARTYPNEVSGVVFVDAPHPSEVIEQHAFRPPLILDAINEGVKNIEKIFDKFKYSEDECIDETISQIQASGLFPNVPVAIVTGKKKMPFVPQAAFDTHLAFQMELLELSARSKHYLCNNSGHFPQVTEPEIVVEAIIDTVDEIEQG